MAARPDDARSSVDGQLVDWTDEQANKQVRKIADAVASEAHRVIKLNVRTSEVRVVEGSCVVNRLEVETGLKFDSLQQVLVSSLTDACPHLPGHVLYYVLLKTSKPILLLLPYLLAREQDTAFFQKGGIVFLPKGE